MASEKSHASKPSPAEVKKVSDIIDQMGAEVGKIFFGHKDVVETLIRAILCNGHVLVEGVPGIAKTLAIKTLATVSGASSKRIQFTVDLLPTDITGLTTYDPKRGFEVVKGPIFANFIVADEINRSPPKTQSAMIEAMQEGQVTIGKETFQLPKPFFVMATQNPLEQEGVYTLPEAQIDRFIFKIVYSYPEPHNEARVMEENVTFRKFEDAGVKAVISPEKIIKMQKLTHKIYLDPKIKQYILDIIWRTRKKDFKNGEFVEIGGSPRASITLYIAAKAEALLRGRNYVVPRDVEKVSHDVLRHRVILSYKATAQGINSINVIDEILKVVKAP